VDDISYEDFYVPCKAADCRTNVVTVFALIYHIERSKRFSCTMLSLKFYIFPYHLLATLSSLFVIILYMTINRFAHPPTQKNSIELVTNVYQLLKNVLWSTSVITRPTTGISQCWPVLFRTCVSQLQIVPDEN
jgi:hypothetical protein